MLVLACIAVPLLVTTLSAICRRVRLTKKGGRLLDALFTMLARTVDLISLNVALTGISSALGRVVALTPQSVSG